MNYTLKIFFFALLMLTYSLHALADENNDILIIPFVKAGGLILIEAELDGQKGNFIFDTGADVLLVNQESEHDKDVHSIHSLNGSFNTSSVLVSHLSLGSFTINSLTAYEADLSSFEELLGNSILGVIGANVFNAEILRIDNIKKTIELLPKRLLPHLNKTQKHSCPVTFDNDIPIIEVNIDGQMYKFALDTGASTSFIDERFAKAHSELFQCLNTGLNLLTASDFSQSLNIYKAKRHISLANVRLSDVSFAAFDLTEINASLSQPIHGILSIDNLPVKELFLDYKDGHIYFLF